MNGHPPMTNAPGVNDAAPAVPPATTIRPARVADVPQIAAIVREEAEQGLMLHKPLSRLYETVRQFHVAVEPEPDADGDAERVLGVCGLSIIWADLAEIVSLAVAPAARGRGLGGALTRACLDEAHALGIRRVMSLTYQQRFFERLGFAVVDRTKLPMKVWAECIHCPKHDACDDIAMMKTFTDLAPHPVPAPPAPASLEVPVVLTNSLR